MISNQKHWFIITAVFLLSSLVLYGYYLFFHPQKLQWVYQTWDGPSYVVIAKSFYNYEKTVAANNIPVVGPGYFAAHFPLYPLFIRLFSFMGYYRSMLFTSNLFSLAALLAFYEIVTRLRLTKKPLWLTLPFILFPPRWFILSRTGSSEPVFIFFSLLMLYFFLKQKHFKAAVAGSLAILTRFQAVHWLSAMAILFAHQAIKQSRQQGWKKSISAVLPQATPYLLMPLVLIGLFWYYKIQIGNFWQFFAVQKGFSQAHWPPFLVFTRNQTMGIQTFWLEGQALVYILYLAGLLSLIFNKKLFNLAIFGLAYYLPYIFWVHMDLSRLLIPVFPLVLIGGEKLFSNKAVVLAIFLLYPAVFSHFIGFTAWNLAP